MGEFIRTPMNRDSKPWINTQGFTKQDMKREKASRWSTPLFILTELACVGYKRIFLCISFKIYDDPLKAAVRGICYWLYSHTKQLTVSEFLSLFSSFIRLCIPTHLQRQHQPDSSTDRQDVSRYFRWTTPLEKSRVCHIYGFSRDIVLIALASVSTPSELQSKNIHLHEWALFDVHSF